MEFGSPGIRPHVHDVDPGGDKAGKHQEVPGFGGIAVAAAAGVPAGMVQLIPQVGHREPMDHLEKQGCAPKIRDSPSKLGVFVIQEAWESGKITGNVGRRERDGDGIYLEKLYGMDPKSWNGSN